MYSVSELKIRGIDHFLTVGMTVYFFYVVSRINSHDRLATMISSHFAFYYSRSLRQAKQDDGNTKWS